MGLFNWFSNVFKKEEQQPQTVVKPVTKVDPIKYRPDTLEELKKLVDNPEVKLYEIDTTKIFSLNSLFKDSTRTDWTGIEKWNVANVTDFRNCFRNCQTFNADLSKWNTRRGRQFEGMFVNTNFFSYSIRDWNMNNVTGGYKASLISKMFKGSDYYWRTNANFYNEVINNIQDKKDEKLLAMPINERFTAIFGNLNIPKSEDYKVMIPSQFQSDIWYVVQEFDDLSKIDTSAIRNFNNVLRNSKKRTFKGIEKMSMESARYCKNFLRDAHSFKSRFALEPTPKYFDTLAQYQRVVFENRRLYDFLDTVGTKYDVPLLKMANNKRELKSLAGSNKPIARKCEKYKKTLDQLKLLKADLETEFLKGESSLPNVVNADYMLSGTKYNESVPKMPKVKSIQGLLANTPAFQADRSGLKNAPILYDRDAFNEEHVASKLKGEQKAKVASTKLDNSMNNIDLQEEKRQTVEQTLNTGKSKNLSR